MGTVHGVYLKYVVLSGLSYVGYRSVLNGADITLETARILASDGNSVGTDLSSFHLGAAAILGYSTLLNGMIAILFKLRWGMALIGKDPVTGHIPLWSYVLLSPFHVPTWIYTTISHMRDHVVPVATEVQDGWWVGGRYGHELDRDWGGIIDLTVEFPELCIDRTQDYLSIPAWDGVPATPAKLEEAAVFAVEARKKGDVLVHCAHGRGRSTTIMVACLVKAGLYETWQEAFEKGIKPQRTVCKLNAMMRENLAAWQLEYVDGKKKK